MTNDGVGLPVRLHDLLLALAGRVDDDALTQARELLAVAELDRAVELLVGCLLAGRIPVSVDERREIGWLLGEVRSDRSLADRLFAVEQVPVPRHRFTVESDPADGLAEVLGRTASVLPDVRSVRATWRSSPAGATPGPLPQRVVLVDIGPAGFAPATAYRVDTVLRKAGIRAAVEVLTVGTPLGEYHAAAVTTAREVFFQTVSAPDGPPDAGAWFDGEVRDEAPVVEPEPVPLEPEAGSKSRRARVDPFEGAQPFPPKPVKRLPVRESVAEEPDTSGVGPLSDDFAREDFPREDTHREDSHHSRAEDAPRADDHARPEGPQRSRDKFHRSADDSHRSGDDSSRNDSHHSLDEAQRDDSPHVRNGTPPSPVEEPLSRSEVTTELGPDDLAALQAALAEGQAPAAVQLPPTVDAKLSDRERALLQQLHEELAQREQQSWPGGPEFVNGVPKPNNGKYPG
ncbi:hypothetical protein ACQPZF_01510 [Actinosynnema sp. CS-041913]|uniref:hypothetical protein n=1 Tax=Actinosynnema sp. CS-041913 TaxID=3239917 RepID=UPI003D8D6D31